ncbi:MAG: insulinase family protein, partial [Oscillospiraceae bacterium]
SNWRALFGVLEGLYKNHTVKDDIAGTTQSIAEITPEMLYSCAQAFYSPSQMILSVAGNITPEQVIAAVERAGLSKKKSEVQKLRVEEPKEINYAQKTIKMPISIPLVAVGFKENFEAPITAEKEIIGDIIMDVLTGSTSELFNKLYDENIVNGTFEGEVFSGTDYYSEIISGETAQPEVLIAEVEAAIDKMKKDGITNEQFETSKNAMYGSMIMDFENVEEVATNIVNSYFNGETVYHSIEVLSKLTLGDVNDSLKHMFDNKKRTIFTVLPSED